MKKSSGFSLIELLVVVAIIALLTTIAVAIYADTQSKARDARRKADIDAIAKTLEVHRSDTGGYQPLKEDQFDPGRGMPKKDSQEVLYCFKVNPGTTLPSGTDAGWNKTNCPSSWTSLAVDIPVAGTTSWAVCAKLENDFTKADGTPTRAYCRFNNQ